MILNGKVLLKEKIIKKILQKHKLKLTHPAKTKNNKNIKK